MRGRGLASSGHNHVELSHHDLQKLREQFPGARPPIPALSQQTEKSHFVPALIEIVTDSTALFWREVPPAGTERRSPRSDLRPPFHSRLNADVTCRVPAEGEDPADDRARLVDAATDRAAAALARVPFVQETAHPRPGSLSTGDGSQADHKRGFRIVRKAKLRHDPAGNQPVAVFPATDKLPEIDGPLRHDPSNVVPRQRNRVLAAAACRTARAGRWRAGNLNDWQQGSGRHSGSPRTSAGTAHFTTLEGGDRPRAGRDGSQLCSTSSLRDGDLPYTPA